MPTAFSRAASEARRMFGMTEKTQNNEHVAPMYQLYARREVRAAGRTVVGSGPALAGRIGHPGPNLRGSSIFVTRPP
jgi:hypothetical protein